MAAHPKFFAVYNNRGATPVTHEARKTCLHQAFRASFTLAASLYIGAADAALCGHLPLGQGMTVGQPVAHPDDHCLPLIQTFFHAGPDLRTGVPGIQLLQHIVIHPDGIQNGERIAITVPIQRVRQGDLPLQLALGTKVHQNLIFNTPAGIGGKAYLLVRLEGGDPFDESDRPDGDQIVLVSVGRVVLF